MFSRFSKPVIPIDSNLKGSSMITPDGDYFSVGNIWETDKNTGKQNPVAVFLPAKGSDPKAAAERLRQLRDPNSDYWKRIMAEQGK